MSFDPTGEVRPHSHKSVFESGQIALTAPNARVRMSRAVQESRRRLLRASNEGTLVTDPAPTVQYRLIYCVATLDPSCLLDPPL